MAFTSVPTVVTGQTWTAANQNTYLRDNFAAMNIGFEIELMASIFTSPAISPATKSTVTSSDAGTAKPRWEILTFDDTAVKNASWHFVVPNNYGSTPSLDLYYYMASANVSKVARIHTYVAAVSDGDGSIDSKASAAPDVHAISVPDTANELDVYSASLTTIDSMAAGDFIVIHVLRDAGHASDNATGDLQLIGCVFKYELS